MVYIWAYKSSRIIIYSRNVKSNVITINKRSKLKFCMGWCVVEATRLLLVMWGAVGSSPAKARISAIKSPQSPSHSFLPHSSFPLTHLYSSGIYSMIYQMYMNHSTNIHSWLQSHLSNERAVFLQQVDVCWNLMTLKVVFIRCSIRANYKVY